MRPRRLHLHICEARFKTKFKHAAHERQSSQNILVILEGEDGKIGLGESLPRLYVTGETAESVFDLIASNAEGIAWPQIERLDDVAKALAAFSDSLFPEHPSARAAVEIALIDLTARRFNVPAMEIIARLADHIGVPRRDASKPVIVSGVLGEAPLGKTTMKALKMRLFGLRQIKVKVGTDLTSDLQKLQWIHRMMGRGVDLRVDANGAWTCDQAIEVLDEMANCGITSVEQPLAKDNEASLPRLRATVKVPVGLDESLTSLADARRAIAGGECDLFNIRLSKCGGVVSSLRILAEARAAGLGAWLGCMVGESGILSSAGRAFALTVDGLRHLEGGYDIHLFAEHLTQTPVTFGRGGKGFAIPGPGWGMDLNRETLDKWTIRRETFDL